jgi:outer membrane receptor protein involved in Fe transport
VLPPFTDEVKLRLAWGQAGNQPTYGFAFSTLPAFVYEGAIAARTSFIQGNPNIKPETSTETEGGFDATFLDGRAAVDFTLFRKVVTDLIVQAAVAPSLGARTRFINGGALRNTGTEIGVNLTPVQRGAFSWLSRTTYSKVSSRVTQLDVPCFNGGSFFSVRFGAPYVCKGYSATAIQVNNGCAVPITGNNPCPRAARTVLGVFESFPSFTMGFSNEFTFGPIRLYSLFDWRHGGKGVNLTNAYFDPTMLRADTASSARRNIRFTQGQPVYLEPAGFVKLREITASYVLPKAAVDRLFSGRTEDVRLEFSGRNLKTWTDYTGYDPEVSNFSNQQIGRFQDVTPYPASRSYFFSIGASF